MDRQFHRSTLLIGRRGAGKTFLLRYQRHTADGFAAYGDLFKILTAIASDTGVGGLSFELDSSLDPLVAAKTNALLAFWITEQAVDKGYPVPWTALQRVLPLPLRTAQGTSGHVTLVELDALYSRLFRAPLDLFSNKETDHALDALLEIISETVDGSMLLLLDRAELVPSPCVRAVFRLMDQSAPYTTVVASRPGLLGRAFTNYRYRALPGDHFNLRHLGSDPYSPNSQAFMRDCLARWMPDMTARMSNEHLAWVVTIARDSVRTGLDLIYNSQDQAGAPSPDATASQLALVQRMLIDAAEGELAEVHHSIRRFLGEVRRRAAPCKPVKLRIHDESDRNLFDPIPIDRTVDLALRVGLFAMPQGTTWHPFIPPRELEIPPLYLWRPEDPMWSTTAS